MKNASRHDLIALVVAGSIWAAFVFTGAGASFFFIPLLFASVLIPAVLTSLLEAPLLARPWLGVAPSVLVAAYVGLFSSNDWAPLIWQSILGGAVLVFVISLAICMGRARAA